MNPDEVIGWLAVALTVATINLAFFAWFTISNYEHTVRGRDGCEHVLPLPRRGGPAAR